MTIRDRIFSKRGNRLAIILIVFITALVYANSLKNSFVGDDFIVIVDNDFVKLRNNFPSVFNKDYFTPDSELYRIGQGGSGSGEASYRPIVTISYFVDYYVWKLNPFGYHLTNLLLHILNTILLFLFIDLIVKNKKIALLTSLFFALHPVNTEAVNVISFREDLLTFLFFISSFIFFIKSKECTNKKYLFYGISIISFLLALLSKEMAITLPIMLFLYDYFFVFTQKKENLLYYFKSRYVAYIVVFAAYLLFFATIINEFSLKYSPGNFYISIARIIEAFTTYIQWLFMPINVRFAFVLSDRPMVIPYSLFAVKALFSLAVIIICFVVIKRYKASKEISFAISWFFITLLPVSNILPIQNFMGSRYLYIPMVAFCFLLALLLFKLPESNIFSIPYNILHKVSRDLIVVLLVFYSIFTLIRNLSFQNNTVFWSEVVENYPNNEMAHMVLGECLMKNGFLDKAISEFKKGISLAPEHAKAKYNNILGVSYYRKKMLNEAEEKFKTALKLDPSFIEAYNNLGIIFGETGRYKEAADCFRHIIKIDSNNLQAYDSLAVTYARTKKWEEARKTWERALEINPKFEAAHNNLKRLIEPGH